MNIIKTNLSQKEPAMNAETVYRVDNAETVKIKHYALETLRADLVGIANIGRFAGAPVKMSPQGVMPSARSVIVMAIHHPDAAIELGGKKHPQEIGPYQIQYHMNWRLDDMSYRMSNFLEKLGWNAVPIVSSNIWRYRGYKDLKEQFAPDVSHIHSAVAAGLAEYGYSGLAITPEFGARVRFVTVITDAELTPSPLLEPGSVCDSCMICKRECRSGALSKEIKGWNVIEYEGRQYRYANKNLWRCSWGEHFDLDLDLRPGIEHHDVLSVGRDPEFKLQHQLFMLVFQRSRPPAELAAENDRRRCFPRLPGAAQGVKRPDRARLETPRRIPFQPDPSLQGADQLRKRVQRPRRVDSGDLPAQHKTAPDRGQPLFPDPGGIENAENRPDARPSAVAVLAEIHGVADRSAELPPPQQQPGRDDREIHLYIGEVVAPVLLHDPAEQKIELRFFIEPANHIPDPLPQRAVGRNRRETGFDNPADIRLRERGRLGGSQKHLAPEAAPRMVHAGVLVSEGRGKFRVAGGQACPELRADRRSHSVGEPVVIAS